MARSTSEIFGEAGKQVSESTRTADSDVPWAAATRMRDRLIHHYFDIDLDILWTTITEDLPLLLKLLTDCTRTGMSTVMDSTPETRERVMERAFI